MTRGILPVGRGCVKEIKTHCKSEILELTEASEMERDKDVNEFEEEDAGFKYVILQLM